MSMLEQVFAGTILSTNGIICEEQEILGYRSRRGKGEALVWRGVFTLPHGIAPPRVRETLRIRLADRSLISLVVTEAVGQSVCFRARGKLPERSNLFPQERVVGEGCSVAS
jgi:hypothetical protein